jgi:hypothetical protein
LRIYLKNTWDLEARGLSDCDEVSWRDWNHAKECPQDGLELIEGDLGFHLLTEEEIPAVRFLFIFFSAIYIITFSIYLF